MGRIRDAGERWVRALYHFRYGPQAYRGRTGDWFADAEEGLLLALTGETDPVRAARALGVDMSDDPTPPPADTGDQGEEPGNTPKRVRLYPPERPTPPREGTKPPKHAQERRNPPTPTQNTTSTPRPRKARRGGLFE